MAFLVYIDTYLGENHIVHRFCLGRVGGSRSSDAPATGWVFVQLIVYSPYVNRTWSLIAFTIFLQVSSFRAAFIYQRGKSRTRKTYKYLGWIVFLMLRIPRNFCWFCILFVVSTRLTEVLLLIWYSFSLYILFSLLSEFWKIWYCNVGIVVSNSSKRSLQAILALSFLWRP